METLASRTVKIWYTHTWISSAEQLHKLLNVDPCICFVYDDVSPQYLFAGEQIYTSAQSMKKFLRLCQTPAIRIFFSLEAISPDFNIFDYAITNDLDLSYGNRAMRMRYSLTSDEVHDFDAPRDMAQARGWLKEKTDFCNFIYSNAQAHPLRDQLFHKICEYRLVHSLGRHLRNTAPPAHISSDILGSIDLKRPYKFSIACENATFRGYTTEKLLTSFQAKTIPIYWGNPEVAREYNPKAFINCHDYENFDQVLEEVKRIDQDDDLWCQMISQPPCTKEQIIQREQDRAALRSFLSSFLLANPDQALRRPQGCWPVIYAHWFNLHQCRGKNFALLRKVKQKIKSLLRPCAGGGQKVVFSGRLPRLCFLAILPLGG